MGSIRNTAKLFIFLGVLLAVVSLISSEVSAAKDLAEKTKEEETPEDYGVYDPDYPKFINGDGQQGGNRGGYKGGNGGGYQGGNGGGNKGGNGGGYQGGNRRGNKGGNGGGNRRGGGGRGGGGGCRHGCCDRGGYYRGNCHNCC
ncbi:glycine-rich protein 3-like [Papaver somniferum]|uniref:glycine-rich protein 3-like n=1 Tax=Papaver somniferum TaxID=3469 RepID=UPI000E700070|nr:glycine-rich protein 3-like [Papaver somniferum]